MKTKIIALTLAAATAFAFTPKPASAGDKGLAVVGGLIGGLIIGAAIADSNNNCAPVYVESTYCPPARVYVAPAPVVYMDGGYWNTTTVNIWVPGAWIIERDYYGRDCRRYVTGHYERRNNRVWIANNRYNSRPDYRHDNRIDRRDDRRDNRNDRRDDRHDNRNDRRDDRHDRR
jgi:hypothetical protein